jgi:hypothetical protein
MKVRHLELTAFAFDSRSASRSRNQEGREALLAPGLLE